MIEFDDIVRAGERIKPLIRRTPLIEAHQLRRPITQAQLFFKLELMQPSGSFKIRGASNKLLSLKEEERRGGLVTASGGNHGLAVARSGFIAQIPATIFLPEGVSADKRAKMKEWGATVIIEGEEFDDADKAARQFAVSQGAAYLSAFADPIIVAGQGTVGLEIIEDLPECDVVIVSVGGGGFITGTGVAIKKIRPDIRLVGVEPVGSPTLYASMQAGRVVTLDAVTTRVPTMSCKRTDDALFEKARHLIDEIVLLRDEEMEEAARWLWFEYGIAADPSGAAAAAALMSGAVRVDKGQKVAVPICGAGLPVPIVSAREKPKGVEREKTIR